MTSGRNHAHHHGICKRGCLTLSNKRHVKLQQFIFSDDRRQRVLRHLLFWGTYMLYFFLACLKPMSYDDLFQHGIYTTALAMFCCFMPVSLFVVYSFTGILLPLLKGKDYVGFSLVLFSIYSLAIVINYFAALIMLNHLDMTMPVVNNHYTRIQNALWTVRESMYIGTVVLGIELAKGWYLQTRTNLAMLKLNAQAEMRFEKSRIHPEWLFNALNQIKASLVAKSATTSTMILNLSDLLSYSLYDSDEDFVFLDQELLELQHLLSLEQGGTTKKFSVTMSTNGDVQNCRIAPMSVINKLVQYIFSTSIEERQLCALNLNFKAIHNILRLGHKRKI
ncbi:MAG: histidine kinase, partial [Sphingobacteriales bacterium]